MYALQVKWLKTRKNKVRALKFTERLKTSKHSENQGKIIFQKLKTVNAPHKIKEQKMILMSRREYARHRGCAVSSVQEAVNTGRITLTNGKINPHTADEEWEDNTNPNYHWLRDLERESKKMTTEERMKQLEREIHWGMTIPLEFVEDRLSKAITLLRLRLLTMVMLTSRQLVGKTDDEIDEILNDKIEECFRTFKDFKYKPPSKQRIRRWLNKK